MVLSCWALSSESVERKRKIGNIPSIVPGENILENFLGKTVTLVGKQVHTKTYPSIGETVSPT